MRAYDGPAALVWSAHSHCEWEVPVRVTVDELPGGWGVRLRSLGDAEEFAFTLVCGAPHELEFPDGSSFAVTVAGDRYAGRFPCEGPEPPHDRWLTVEEYPALTPPAPASPGSAPATPA